MLSKTLILLSVSLFALAVPVQERDVSTILTDLEVVDNDILEVSSDLNNLTTTSIDVLITLQVDANNLIHDLEKTIADVEATGPLDEGDGQAVGAKAMTGAQDLISVLGQFEAAHDTFEKLSADVPELIQDIEMDLETLSNVVQTFANALNAIDPSDVVSAGLPLGTAVAKAFESAIDTFED